jgi:hypothetical protein
MSGVFDTPYYENPSADFHNKFLEGISMILLRSLSLMILFFCQALVALAFERAEDPTRSVIQFYQNRYKLQDTSTKLVDNLGNGFIDLYGIRNFRVVLNGILYRGGANNYYNKNGVRDNKNPLPKEGLTNLCKEGFANVYYLYTNNYDKKINPVNCQSSRGFSPNKFNFMNYLQKSPMEQEGQYEILKTIYQTIQNPTNGPVYVHCWNGWHASGLISALALQQFCRYNADEAVQYWDANIDIPDRERKYDKVRARIQSFVPFQDLKIDESKAALICLPHPKQTSHNFEL